MKARTFLIGLFGFFILLSCREEPPVFPEETQEGLGVFACLINGELVTQEGRRWGWVGPGPFSVPGRPPVMKQDTCGRFVLVAHMAFDHTFHFFISQPQMGQNVIDSVFFWHGNRNDMYVARNVSSIHFTRFDSIASGTFAFDADGYDRHTRERIPNRKIEVRRGRFDVWIKQTLQ
ncbi:MAG: hypothetical protein FWD02_01225 [Bacteroidales bacterium]|nr:hypothetical protein [Bacteroidales bacterium]